MAMQSTDPLLQVVDPNFPGMGMDWLENSVEWLDDNMVSFLLFAGHSLRVPEKEANPY